MVKIRMDAANDRVTIKQLLFSKAVPNHVIPIPTAGYKVYACIDCGDKYLFQSSYEYHINRKSMEITYTCRFCNFVTHTFYNRCNLLAHIRNHAFKTATINLSDLKVQPLPLELFKIDPATTSSVPDNDVTIVDTPNVDTPTVHNDRNCNGQDNVQNIGETNKQIQCHECNATVGVNFRQRAKHFMGLSDNVYTCPLCLFVLPTLCAFKTHIRNHVRSPPYYCPECGIILRPKALVYPYSHHCEGFKMMRVNARLKCPLPSCYLYHPSEHKEHMEACHLKKVYKCSVCVVASFSKPVMEKHVATHDVNYVPLVFYQCELCPGRLVMEYQYKNHVKGHLTSHVFPCRSCSSIFKEVPTLVQHYSTKHATKNMAEILMNILNDSEEMYYVIKRCEKCKRSFRYKCKYCDINNLPTDCPYNCFKSPDEETGTQEKSIIICHLCKCSVPDNWTDIKAHYASEHKSFKCLDLKLNIPRSHITNSPKLKLKRVSHRNLLLRKRLNKKMKRKIRKKPTPLKKTIEKNAVETTKKTLEINVETNKKTSEKNTVEITEKTIEKNAVEITELNKYKCTLCEEKYGDKALLQEHFVKHKDPYMAYQCMECGKCFVVKPSFSIHLLLEHQISNPDAYIEEKNCYNQKALIKNDFNPSTYNEPVKENQCNICMEQFDNPDNLEKHFRVHGMAFLIKNKSKSP